MLGNNGKGNPYLCTPCTEPFLQSKGVEGIRAKVPDPVFPAGIQQGSIDSSDVIPPHVQLPTKFTCNMSRDHLHVSMLTLGSKCLHLLPGADVLRSFTSQLI